MGESGGEYLVFMQYGFTCPYGSFDFEREHDQSVWIKKRRTFLNFAKKSVDNKGEVWYYNKAVTEDRENKEMRRICERVVGAKTSKSFKKST